MAQALVTIEKGAAQTLSLPVSVQRSLSGLKAGSTIVATEGPYRFARTVMTIPASLAPSKADRSLIARKIGDLTLLLAQTDLDYSTGKVAEMLLSFSPSMTQSTATVRTRGYIVALDDVPTFAVVEACRRWLRHEAGKFGDPNDQRNPPREPDYAFPPTPPILRVLALRVAGLVDAQRQRLQDLLKAEVVDDPREHTEADRERMSNLLAELAAHLRGRNPRPMKRGVA